MTFTQVSGTREFRASSALTQADVSVIVPTYNRSTLVERAIRSVIETTCSDVELIICDDGSTDETRSRVARLQQSAAIRHQIRYLTLPHSGLAATARNAGLKACNRALIAFLDSDDVWLPGKLSAQLREFNNLSDLALCWTNALRLTLADENVRTSDYHPPGSLPLDPELSHLVRSNPVITSSVVMRSSILESSGDFREVKGVEDWDLWYRIALRGPVRYLDQPFLEYTSGSTDRLSHMLPEADVIKNTVRMLRRFLKESKRQRPDDRELHRSICMMLAIHRRQELANHFNAHRWRAIPRSFAELLLSSPGDSSRTAARLLASILRGRRRMWRPATENVHTLRQRDIARCSKSCSPMPDRSTTTDFSQN